MADGGTRTEAGWSTRRQARLDAPIERVWSLVGDPDSYDEWWPRIVRTETEEVATGCEYRQVVKVLFGREEHHTVGIEELEGCQAVQVRCLEPGIWMRWALLPAQGGTFVEGEFGLELESFGQRVKALVARPFLRTWLDQSLDALDTASARPAGDLSPAS